MIQLLITEASGAMDFMSFDAVSTAARFVQAARAVGDQVDILELPSELDGSPDWADLLECVA